MNAVPTLTSWPGATGRGGGGASTAPGRYELVTSAAVLDELAAGPTEPSAERMALLDDLPLLPIELAVAEIVEAYIQHKLMPADPGGDALHLALASYHNATSSSPGTALIWPMPISSGTFGV